MKYILLSLLLITNMGCYSPFHTFDKEILPLVKRTTPVRNNSYISDYLSKYGVLTFIFNDNIEFCSVEEGVAHFLNNIGGVIKKSKPNYIINLNNASSKSFNYVKIHATIRKATNNTILFSGYSSVIKIYSSEKRCQDMIYSTKEALSNLN